MASAGESNSAAGQTRDNKNQTYLSASLPACSFSFLSLPFWFKSPFQGMNWNKALCFGNKNVLREF